MAAVKKTKYGEIKISGETIAQVAGEAATSCYGVMGLVSKPSLGASIYEFLKSSEYLKGVYCRKTKNGYSVDVYIVVAYGVKLTEVIGDNAGEFFPDVEHFNNVIGLHYEAPSFPT